MDAGCLFMCDQGVNLRVSSHRRGSLLTTGEEWWNHEEAS